MKLESKPLYVILCDNGSIYIDHEDRMAVYSNDFHADEALDNIGHAGWDCRCRNTIS
jgi:hypothetical protein